MAEQQEFSSLSEFDEFAAALAASNGEDENIEIFSNSFLVDPELLDVPSDPFSPEYLDAVLRIHAAVSGRASYDVNTMEHTPLDIAHEVDLPSAYRFDGKHLAGYLDSYAHVIRRLDVGKGSRVVELGCGDAEISLHLARLGCDVWLVDIEPDYLEIVEAKARRLGVRVNTVCGQFATALDYGPFDRAFFYQSFHHDLHHQSLVARFRDLVGDEGKIVLAAEPILEEGGPWMRAVPYPWGPRLDGLSLRAMRTHGWMELGFHRGYVVDLLARNGWSAEFETSERNGLASSLLVTRASS